VSHLRLRGAREGNLAGLDLDLPLGRLVVMTGVSGCGKSTLAWDVLHAEGRRRLVEALSAGRQGTSRPDFDTLDGLPPTLGIGQRERVRTGPRSTVGGLSDLLPLLRLLFSREGQQRCPTCARPVTARSRDAIRERLMAAPNGTRLTLLAPRLRGRTGSLHTELDGLQGAGFVRVRLDGRILRLEEVGTIDARLAHDLDVVVDRVKVAPDRASRIAEAVQLALEAGDGRLIALIDDHEVALSERAWCSHCDASWPEARPDLLSFDTRAGACERCAGLGLALALDLSKLVRAPQRSVNQGALAAWIPSRRRRDRWAWHLLERAALRHGWDLDAPFADLPSATREMLVHGAGDFGGAAGVLRSRGVGAEEAWRSPVPCEACSGARLGPIGRSVHLGGHTLPALCALPVRDQPAWLSALDLAEDSSKLRAEITRRLALLERVGLGHLSPDRAGPTLSHGEVQRLRLANLAGSRLAGVLYILDEPTAGLHPHDVEQLLPLLSELTAGGASVLVVEHDRALIEAADLVIDLGPGAGPDGGQIVFAGPPGALGTADTTTARWLSGRAALPPHEPRPGTELTLQHVAGRTLQIPSVSFLRAGLTVVRGVSGSGKSSLVFDALGRAVAADPNRPSLPCTVSGAEGLRSVVAVDARLPTNARRSSVATWTGIWDALRKMFAATKEAKVRGWGPGWFSLGARGGRCELCAGAGRLEIDLGHLPPVWTSCEGCEGQRFDAPVLEVRYRGLHAGAWLACSVSEARDRLAGLRSLEPVLTALAELGLGHLALGRTTGSLSGGEARRLKLARALGKKRDLPETLLLLDEPAGGLHPKDVAGLCTVLHALCDRGATVVAIDHDPGLWSQADRLITLGPGAGPAGGRLLRPGGP